ncbi:MAG: alanyl-tRNA editing protein [Pseudacidovorax sp.]|nr:alanyl-tRNA editing protein [Pseudacidovorax sp.]
MTRLFCQDHPEILTLDAEVVRTRPGEVLVSQHPFYPGGGGQLPDRGLLRWQGGEARVTGFAEHGGSIWIELAGQVEVTGSVQLAVEPGFRQLMRELHTDLHVLNALVFRDFDGALVTGVQMNDDGSARIDFDLPEADNDRLRALEAELNDVIAQDLAVRTSDVSMTSAHAEAGLLRSRSVTPLPSSEGLIRVVEIVGLDRQACGGTHLASTGASRPVCILKVENKGRFNRRVRIGLQDR